MVNRSGGEFVNSNPASTMQAAANDHCTRRDPKRVNTRAAPIPASAVKHAESKTKFLL